MIEIGSALDPGRKRQANINQDALCVVWPRLLRLSLRAPLMVVADGMGGYEGGAVASQTVINCLAQAYLHAPGGEAPLKTLQTGVKRALARLKETAAVNPGQAKMGSTVVAAVCDTRSIHLLNVGDSRAYRINREQVLQISHDHSLVADQLRQGLIAEEDVRRHPRRNVLSMSISAQRDQVETYSGVFPWKPGDHLLLCSDGLWGPVTERQMQAVVLEFHPQQAAEKLAALANANHGPDNIAVIVARRS